MQDEFLRGRNRGLKVQDILYGRPGTAMPPWSPFLSETEAAWLADLLLERAP